VERVNTIVFTLCRMVNTRVFEAVSYFHRTIDAELEAWSREEDRKPLVLRGARQVGKSSAVRQLGASFELFIELNLERYADLALVRASRSPAELLQALAARHNLQRFPPRTLLFLDEIQESPEAVQWLRFFHEEHPQLAVVAAGSLMEVRLEERGFSFPVGRVTFRSLSPMTFFEFLGAQQSEVLGRQLLAAAHERQSPPALHAQALELLRDYLFVGGMPEAVQRWTSRRQSAAVREVHLDLWQALAEDIQKYRSAVAVADIEAAFDSLRHHYGQRFRYEAFAPGYKSEKMKSALGKLESAYLISRVWPTSSLALPLEIKARSAPKLLPLDIGLALHASGTGYESLRQEKLEKVLSGRNAEIFAGQQFVANEARRREPLHFWVSESSKANAEVDYLLPGPGYPLPVEIKAGASGSLKSLHLFLHRAGLGLGIRLHAGPAAEERHEVKVEGGRLTYRLLSLPIYLAEEVENLIRQSWNASQPAGDGLPTQ
jgi:predicted AAA+ superfamily ATPase